MSFNSDTFALMAKFAGAMICVLLLIWLIAVGTPFAAKLIEKCFGRFKVDKGPNSVPIPERVDNENGGNVKPSEYKVYDIYEGSPSEKDDNTENINKEV